MIFDRSKYNKCNECPLRDRNRVYGRGPGSGPVPIALIGEAPGRDEDAAGEPFVGAAGRMLNYALGKAGILRHRCWITNVISCRPPANDFDSSEAIEATELCKPGFQAELKYVKKRGLKVIAPLGNNAMIALGLESGITKFRGSVFVVDAIPIVPTFHPSFIQRGNFKHEVTWLNDFEKIKKLSIKPYVAPKENFNIYPTLQDLEEFLHKSITKKLKLGTDIETTGLDPQYAEIMMVGFALSATEAISFPFYSKGMKRYWSNQEQDKAMKILRQILLRPLMFQNSMFDLSHLHAAGLKAPDLAEDIMLAHHALHPELPHTLGYITSVYGFTPYWKEEFKIRSVPIGQMEDEKVRTYNLRDSVVLHQILPGLLRDLKATKTLDVYRKISLPLVHPVMAMTYNGMNLDKKKLSSWKAGLKRKEKKLLDELYVITKVPKGFNFDSGDHLRLLIYNSIAPQFSKALTEYEKYLNPGCKLRKDTAKYKTVVSKVGVLEETLALILPAAYKTRKKTGRGRKLSVDAEALLGLQIACNNRLALSAKFLRKTKELAFEREELQRSIQFFKIFSKYQEVSKLLSTYTDFKVGKDKRVHPGYLIHGTKTGRLASRNPNAQNIPAEARKVFTAPKGSKILQADYSNLELRVLAYISNDDVLIGAFERGENVHDINTRDLFGITPKHPNWKVIRRAAKIYIFGRNYGGGLWGIYKRVLQEVPELTFTFNKFKEVDARYRSLHPRYTAWYRKTVEEVVKTKQLRNAFGRIRIFLGLEEEVIREGLNFGIQSTAADIINQATILIHRDLPTGVKLIGQIHDALLFEVKDNAVKKLTKLIRKHMEKKFKIGDHIVQFPVDLEIGASWGTLKKLKQS